MGDIGKGRPCLVRVRARARARVRVRARARVRPARLEGGDLVREHVGCVVDDQVKLPGYLVRVGVRVWGRGRVWV